MRLVPPRSHGGETGSPNVTDATDRARHHAADASRIRPSNLLLVVLGLYAGVFTWSLTSVIPGGGLDDSWLAGLYLARENGLHFGSEIHFTYGPLGFLAHPYLFSPLLGLVAWLVASGTHLLLCVAIAITTARQSNWLVRAWLLAMGAIASLYIGPLASISCIVAMLLLLRPKGLPRGAPELRDYAIIGVVAAVAAIGLLTKTNHGLVLIAIGLAFSLTRPAWLSGVLTFIAALVATTGFLWVSTGQQLSDFGPWVRGSAELVLGYSSAMGAPGIEGYPRLDARLMDAVTTLSALIALLVVVQRARQWRPVDAAVVIAAFGFFVFQGYKEGTVRHAPMGFLASLFVVVAWLPPWRNISGTLRPVTLAIVGIAFLVALQFNPAALRPVERVTSGVAQLATLVEAQLREAPISNAKAHLRASYAVPPAMLSRIGSAPLHVAPYDAAVVWAYPDMVWSPLPVFQAYAAYTAHLDSLNAAAIASPDGPAFVLRKPNATIDGRSEWYEAPRTMLVLACNFREVMAGGQWQLLERGIDRCAAPRLILTVKARSGETVSIPAPVPGSIVTARIHGLDADLLDRVRTFLASSLIWTVTLSDGTAYRLVPKTADGPLIVAGAPGLIYGSPNGPPSTSTLSISAGDSLAVPFDDQPDIELSIEIEVVAVGP